jgi:hypothetical protein
VNMGSACCGSFSLAEPSERNLRFLSPGPLSTVVRHHLHKVVHQTRAGLHVFAIGTHNRVELTAPSTVRLSGEDLVDIRRVAYILARLEGRIRNHRFMNRHKGRSIGDDKHNA